MDEYVCSTPCRERRDSPCFCEEDEKSGFLCSKGLLITMKKKITIGKDVKLYDANSECDHILVGFVDGNGIECVKCRGWFYFKDETK